MKTKNMVSAAIGMACCSGFIGCGADSEQPKEKVTIAWLAKGAQNNFFDLSRHASQLAAADLASASGREVEVRLMDAEEQLPEAQLAKLEEAIAMGVDAINVSVLSPDVLTPAIDKATDAGIKVLTFDSDAPASKRISYYGIDNLEGAKVSARLLAKLLGENGKVAIMTATSTSATYTERMSGFASEIANYPNIAVVSEVKCDKAEETDKAGCTKVLEETIALHPEITGWYLARGRVLREAQLENLAPTWAASVLSGKVKVVGFDAPEDALHSVKKGLVQGLITQDYFGWGYDVVSLSFDVVTIGRKLAPFTDSKFEVACANNIDALISMWAAKDFRQSLAKCDLMP